MINQPFLQPGAIEFFQDNNKTYCLESGRLVAFADITPETYRAIYSDFIRHSIARSAMYNAGIVELSEQLEQYVKCRYGLFNRVPDFISGQPNDKEEVQLHCNNHSCKLKGILCEVISNLTSREITICKLVSEGLSDKEISHILHIATVTVSTHITNILEKLKVSSRAAVAAFTALNSLIENNRVPQRHK